MNGSNQQIEIPNESNSIKAPVLDSKLEMNFPKLDKPSSSPTTINYSDQLSKRIKSSVDSAHKWVKDWYESKPNSLYRAEYNEAIDKENRKLWETYENSRWKDHPSSRPPILRPQLSSASEENTHLFKEDKFGLNVPNPLFDSKFHNETAQSVSDFHKRLNNLPNTVRVMPRDEARSSDAPMAYYNGKDKNIYVNPRANNGSLTSTLVHEMTHALSARPHDPSSTDINFSKRFKGSYYTGTDSDLDTMERYIDRYHNGKLGWEHLNDILYNVDPAERYSKLNETRLNIGFSPNKTYSDEQIEQRLGEHMNEMQRKMKWNPFKRNTYLEQYQRSDEFLNDFLSPNPKGLGNTFNESL